jgi:hypothetical protein
MRRTTVTLKSPLCFDVKQFAEIFSEYRYIGPEESFPNREMIFNDANCNQSQFLYFGKKTENGFCEIGSDFSPQELAAQMFSTLGYIPQQLMDALKGTSLELPEITDELMAKSKKDRQKVEQENLMLKKISTIGQEKIIGPFTSEKAMGVFQRDVAITCENSQKPILGTYGAGPCIIVAAFNPITKQALLAHMDSSTDSNSLSKYIDIIKGDEPEAKIHIHLAGADNSSKKELIELLRFLQTRTNTSIISADILNGVADSYPGPRSLAIDSRTGEIFTQFDPKQLFFSSPPELQALAVEFAMLGQQQNSLALTFSYDGRKDLYNQQVPRL